MFDTIEKLVQSRLSNRNSLKFDPTQSQRLILRQTSQKENLQKFLDKILSNNQDAKRLFKQFLRTYQLDYSTFQTSEIFQLLIDRLPKKHQHKELRTRIQLLVKLWISESYEDFFSDPVMIEKLNGFMNTCNEFGYFLWLCSM